MTTTDALALSLNLWEDERGRWVPSQYVGNYLKEQDWEFVDERFDDQGNVVIDKATDLMWELSGSEAKLTYEAARMHINQLNNENFGGYNDWRLPTIEELLSLVEKEEKKRNFFELTGKSFADLMEENIFKKVLNKLQSLRSKRFYSEKNFLDTVQQHIGEKQSDEYTTLILDHTTTGEDGLHIDKIFDYRQSWCWSADTWQAKDKSLPGSAWLVYFDRGNVRWGDLDGYGYVRAVRAVRSRRAP